MAIAAKANDPDSGMAVERGKTILKDALSPSKSAMNKLDTTDGDETASEADGDDIRHSQPAQSRASGPSCNQPNSLDKMVPTRGAGNKVVHDSDEVGSQSENLQADDTDTEQSARDHLPLPEPTPRSPNSQTEKKRDSDDADLAAIDSRASKKIKATRKVSSRSGVSQTSAKSNIVVNTSSSPAQKRQTVAPPPTSGAEPEEQEGLTKLAQVGDKQTEDTEEGDDNTVAGHPAATNSKQYPPPGEVGAAPVPVSSGDTKYNIAFSNSTVTECKGLMRFLKKHCKYQENVDNRTDVLCVGKVSTTSKLLRAMVRGIPIISDEWITKSSRANEMLNPEDFHIRDDDFKKQYGRYLADAAGDGCEIFSNRAIYMTPAVKKAYGTGYKDIAIICKAAGAKEVISIPAGDLIRRRDSAIVVGAEEGDLDAIALHDNGYQVRTKDFLSHSILRGVLRWDGTYTFTPGLIKASKRTSRGRRSG